MSGINLPKYFKFTHFQYQELVDKTETTSVSPLPNLVDSKALPVKCGMRMVDDNPMDPLGQPKVVKGEPTKPGAYPWQVNFLRISI